MCARKEVVREAGKMASRSSPVVAPAGIRRVQVMERTFRAEMPKIGEKNPQISLGQSGRREPPSAIKMPRLFRHDKSSQRPLN